ncbi:MAG: hypothetical protein PF447_03900 [Spirochaetaceae bacterium]|jgi:hypothetical protein|nr:hypothetical protein [Spirochaetaceae bacterium]
MKYGWLFAVLIFFSCTSIDFSKNTKPVYQKALVLEVDEFGEDEPWPLPDFYFQYTKYLSLDLPIVSTSFWILPEFNSALVPPSQIQENQGNQVQIPNSRIPSNSNVTVPQEEPQVITESVPEPTVERLETEVIGQETWGISLPGGGWQLLEDRQDGEKVRLQQRNQNNNKTNFTFAPLPEGRYLLVFSKQDNQRGGQQEIHYSIMVPSLEDPPAADEIVNQDQSASDEINALIEDQTETDDPQVLLEQLKQVEEDHNQTAKSIDLLEELLKFNWHDEESAGFYYRLARQLERNGVTQDIHRSYEIYQYIQEQFFLSSYYDLAGERMLYLNRHFLRLQ